MEKVDLNNSPDFFNLKKNSNIVKKFQHVPASSQNLKGLLKVNKKKFVNYFFKACANPSEVSITRVRPALGFASWGPYSINAHPLGHYPIIHTKKMLAKYDRKYSIPG
jgi:hypothetical protein